MTDFSDTQDGRDQSKVVQEVLADLKIGRNCKIEIDQKKGPERNDRKKKWVMDMRN